MQILGVYDDMALADLCAKEYGGEVGPMVLNPCAAELRAGLHMFHVMMTCEGATEIDTVSTLLWPSFGWEKGVDDRTAQPRTRISMWIFAQDTHHAVKIVNEKRGIIIALNLWGNEEHEVAQAIGMRWSGDVT